MLWLGVGMLIVVTIWGMDSGNQADEHPEMDFSAAPF